MGYHDRLDIRELTMSARHCATRCLLALLLSTAGIGALAAESCPPLPGFARALPAAGVLLVGEIHGNAEMPQAFVRIVCTALQQGQPVSVGLELSKDQAAPLQTYLASDGDAASRHALLSTLFWQKVRDGRTSAAYLAMIDQLRQLRREHARLTVFVLYEEDADAPRQLPDHIMANRIRKETMVRPGALVLANTGNFHSMLAPPPRGMQASNAPPLPQPMGALLGDLAPVSINLVDAGGTSWTCMKGGCGVHDLVGGAVQPVWQLAESGEPMLYSFDLNVGKTTASAPAATK